MHKTTADQNPLEHLAQLFTNPIVDLAIGVVVTAIVAYIFYRLSRRTKEPTWDARTNVLIQGYGSKIKGLIITYGNTAIENLSITKVLFWNNGKGTMSSQDIASADPLR